MATLMDQNAPFFVDTEVITLASNGLWLSDGIEIDHEGTRRLFARNIGRDDQGYFIQVAHETKRINVEDTPYFIHRVDHLGDGRIQIWLNDDTQEILNAKTLSYRPGRLTCKVKSAQFEAKLLRAAYFDLLQSLEEDEQGYWIELQGARVMLMRKS